MRMYCPASRGGRGRRPAGRDYELLAVAVVAERFGLGRVPSVGNRLVSCVESARCGAGRRT